MNKLFRKKPIVIEAYQTTREEKIETLEGVMLAQPGDWIITGVKGERYPCKPDIFKATYEEVLCSGCDNNTEDCCCACT